jgi:iron complex transport system ATP-binding protein
LEHVSLQIPQGTILAVIGPNGTGKSTLLKSLAKQLALLEGTIFIGKDDLQQLSYQQLSRKMSVVFTGRVRPELLQCYDVVAAGRYPYTGYFGLLGEEDKACIFEAMEQMQVTEFATRDFQTLSDGQKQRVLIARALCQQPEILVLDEPTSYLDIRYKLELMDLLRSLATEQNMTILLSIHLAVAGKCFAGACCSRCFPWMMPCMTVILAG